MDFDGLISTAQAVGLDALAITDHDTVEGALEFRRLAASRGLRLQIIVGEERTLSDGSHLIGLFLDELSEGIDAAGDVLAGFLFRCRRLHARLQLLLKLRYRFIACRPFGGKGQRRSSAGAIAIVRHGFQ